MFRKITALILVPLFLLSNISFADSIKIEKATLAPASILELLSDPTFAAELGKVSQIGGSAEFRMEDFATKWIETFAALLVKKYIEKAGIKAEEFSSRREQIEKEVIGQIRALVATGKIPDGLLTERLAAAVKRELNPGALAGFTGKDLPRDVDGINVRDLFDRTIAKLVSDVKPVLVKDLISSRRQVWFSDEESRIPEIKIFPIKNLVAEFKELFRAELKAKGYDEPTREKIINEYALEVISHPGIARESIYIDSLYYNILTNAKIYENWEELMIQLIKHEYVHIADRNVSEEEAHKRAPIDDVVEALKKRTILIAQSGGDCAGLNAVVAAATEELTAKGYIPMGVREGFAGMTSDKFNENYRIQLDVKQAERIRERPSTELFSSREAPFKAVDWYRALIASIKDEDPRLSNAHKSALENIIMKISDWNALERSETEALDDMRDLLLRRSSSISDKSLKKSKDKEKDIKKTFDKFVNFMKNLDAHGGLIVTGGDDHCRIALKAAEFGKMAVAVPKSIDNDAMTQMLGFYKTAKHFRGRFLLGAITGQNEKKVFVAEIMGRNAGWLALAAGDRAGRVPEKVLMTLGKGDIRAGKKKAEFINNTVITIVPEKTVSILAILKRVQEIYEKHGVINMSVSEGYKVDPKDPLLAELRSKNPLIDDVWKSVDAGKIETDTHGHPKLEGATDFIVAILTTRWENADAKKYDTIKLKPDQVKHVILGYTGRGLKPGDYDLQMGDKLTRMAVQLIEEGKSGWMATYPDKGLHPYEVQPLARPVSEVLDGRSGKKYPKDLHTLGQGDELRYIRNDLAVRGFRILSNAELASRGVLFETIVQKIVKKEGIAVAEETKEAIGYPLKDFEPRPEETVLDFFTAVKLLREDLISSSISAYTHRRSSIFEVPDNNGLLTLALSDKYPANYDDWDDVDKSSWEKLRPGIMALVPGQEKPIKEIVEEAVRIKKENGLVFIVVGSGYKFSMRDEGFADLIRGDAYLSAKFGTFAKNIKSAEYGGAPQATVNYISHYIRAALMKYAPKEFSSKSSANCNLLGQMYTVVEPDQETAMQIVANPTIREVKQATEETANHLFFGDSRPVGISNMIVIVNKKIANFGTGSGSTTEILKKQYHIMKQSLVKMFQHGDDKGVIEVDSEADLEFAVDDYLSLGYKVIVLDNGKLTADIKQDKNLRIVSFKQLNKVDLEAVPFINLNAMAMMGVGMFNKDYRLFALAYKNFTGEEPPARIASEFENNLLWFVSIMPRMIRLTGKLVDENIIKRLFAAAA
ncbi:MAG: 6-phosphofructokinase [Candidatus Omnitrophica bacterium]|nr:6-phosphofructokinase [Candidatus Omnitrophota bacterium]